jgi:hypothetical protein
METKKVKEAEQNAIITQLKQFASLGSDRQRAFYEQELKDLHKVQVVSVHDVFTQDEIRRIKKIVRPLPRMCYRNAHLMVELFPDKCQYVEGFTTIFNGGFPIEHAWNKVGNVYVDVTYEMALEQDVKKELYMALGAYNLMTITQAISETGYYGGIYTHRYIKTLNLNK